MITISARRSTLQAFYTKGFSAVFTCHTVYFFGMFLTVSGLQLSVISLILIHPDTSVIIQSVIVTLQDRQRIQSIQYDIRHPA